MLNVIQKRLKNHIIGEGTFLIEKGKANIPGETFSLETNRMLAS